MEEKRQYERRGEQRRDEESRGEERAGRKRRRRGEGEGEEAREREKDRENMRKARWNSGRFHSCDVRVVQKDGSGCTRTEGTTVVDALADGAIKRKETINRVH